MDLGVSSVVWVFIHMAVAGVMATMGYLDLRLWLQDRTLKLLHITGMLCWSVALTLCVGAVGLAVPDPETFRLVVPIRAILIGITVALFLQTQGSLVPLPGLRAVMAASVAVPVCYGALGVLGEVTYSFVDGSPWPQVQPTGDALVAVGIVILAAYTIRTLMVISGLLRRQLLCAVAVVTAILVVGIGSDPGVLSEAMTTFWTLPIAVLLAAWSSGRLRNPNSLK